MKNITLGVTKLFMFMDDLCEKKHIEKREGKDGKVGVKF
jgi:hypothetical protein